MRSISVINNCVAKYLNHVLYRSKPLVQSDFRRLSSNATNSDPLKKESEKHGKVKAVKPPESLKIVKDRYAKSFWNRHKERKKIYVADTDVANSIAEELCKHNQDVYIFEVNPGPGVLTKALLEAGASKIRVFEDDAMFLGALRDFLQSHPNAIEIVEKDFFLSSQTSFTELQSYFVGIEKRLWNEGIPLKIFFTAYGEQGTNFIRSMFAQLSRFASIFSLGRCQFFVLLSDKEYSHIIASPQENPTSYTYVTVLYNLFFDVQYIQKFSMTSFLPERKKHQTSHLHFVKLTPKENLLEVTVPQKALPHLHFFVRQNVGKNFKRTTVIKTLEQWIPNCGLHFIKRGLHVFARFVDLTPVQILEVFKQFSSLPSYNACNFHFAARGRFMSRKRLKRDLNVQ